MDPKNSRENGSGDNYHKLEREATKITKVEESPGWDPERPEAAGAVPRGKTPAAGGARGPKCSVATIIATVLDFCSAASGTGRCSGRGDGAGRSFEDQARRDFNPVVAYGITFVLGFIASYVFGLHRAESRTGVRHRLRRRGGLCWVATSLATNYLFEGRPAALIATTPDIML